MTITLNLSIEQVNVILQSLMQGPYGQVASVITAIESQGKAQLQTTASEDKGVMATMSMLPEEEA